MASEELKKEEKGSDKEPASKRRSYNGVMTLADGIPYQSVTVTKANALIVCQNTLKASHMKVLNAAISIIDPQGEYERPHELGITVVLTGNQICELTNISRKYLMEFIDAAATAFHSHPIHNPVAPANQINYINIALNSVYIEEEDKFKITFHPDLVGHLIDLNRKRFTSYHLRYQVALDGRYQMLFYELVAMHYNRAQGGTQYRRIELDTLYYMLGLTEKMGSDKIKFGRFTEVRRRILEPACEAISKKTNFQVSFDVYKKGRSVDGIIIAITQQWVGISNTSDAAAMSPVDALIDCGVSSDLAAQWLSEYGQEVIEKNMALFKQRASLGERIKNPTAYLSSLISRNVACLPAVASPFSDRYRNDPVTREFVFSVVSRIWWKLDENLRALLEEPGSGLATNLITGETLSLYATSVKELGIKESAEIYSPESVLQEWNESYQSHV